MANDGLSGPANAGRIDRIGEVLLNIQTVGTCEIALKMADFG